MRSLLVFELYVEWFASEFYFLSNFSIKNNMCT